MNKNLQIVFDYHERTKHSHQRYARSLGYMDWATQPDPFREYKGTQQIVLPLALENPTPPYSLLDEDLPCAPLLKESLSQLLQFSLGIAAWKSSGGSSWAVRCNASSGNLHPTECYLLLPPMMDSEKSTIMHYAPKEHTLEQLTAFDTDFWKTVPEGSFLLGLSTIPWREAWKYGERAFRYTQLDAGHAYNALVVSAKLLGWQLTRIDSLSDAELEELFGLSQKERFFEEEIADMLFIVSKKSLSSSHDFTALFQDLPQHYEGIANRLSSSMHEWEIISRVAAATSETSKALPLIHDACRLKRLPSKEAKEVILKRRSIHVMDKEKSHISAEQFHILLNAAACSQDGRVNAVHLLLFVHRVAEYKQGLYILVREESALSELQKEFKAEFLWQKTAYKNLYLLEIADYTDAAKIISCNQDIASDGAFSLGMFCRYADELLECDAHRYKELYWECGAIGQQLYLEATSLGLSGNRNRVFFR